MKPFRFLVLFLMVFSIVAFLAADANAKRFGGGRSFGSRNSYSRSYSSSIPHTTTTPGSTNMGRARSGGFGRTGMGLFGGLLAGSLLGSMFFGGGRFMGPGIMDFLLIGLVIFFALKFFRGRRNSSGMREGRYQRGPDQNFNGRTNYSESNDSFTGGSYNSGSAWDHLSSKPSGHTTSDNPHQTQSGAIPPDFDQEEFLKGAKAMYIRLQGSWDERNLEDIKEFTSHDVYKEIASQAAEDPEPSTTEILLVNAKILEVKDEGNDSVVTVYYDALLREDSKQSQPSQVREVWHFIKDNNSNGIWKLDGLQQLEN